MDIKHHVYFTYMCVCGLDDALGCNPSFEVLEQGGLHLVVTKVVPVWQLL